jgi:hypothetical protein|tara:strand:- start:1242 stop:1412 length:171 start_codon:yes stop_codon:yes gene_type:complete
VKNSSTGVKEDAKVLDSADNISRKTPIETKSQREDGKSAYSNKLNFVNRKIQGAKE